MHSPGGFFVLMSRPLHAANAKVTLLIVHSIVLALSFCIPPQNPCDQHCSPPPSTRRRASVKNST